MRGIAIADGPFRRLRWWADAGLIAFLVALPWVRFGGGESLVLLDIPRRQFHLLGTVFFPQELYFLWLVIVGLALVLFFVTSLLGRMWCGYACPQTVFTDVFAWLERRIQGWKGSTPPRRVAVWRRIATHAIWLMIAAVVAFHLVGYFVSPYAWPARIAAGEPGLAGVFLVVLTVVAFADFAYVRQVFCKTVCPYARFQGVLFDRDTLVIAYDPTRGEPRGHKGTTTGDCVDCGRCVQVCPSGIDIRDGLQLECIACTHCIDACDDVMLRLDREPGLIAYRSEASLEGGPRLRLLRPRVLVYGGLLAIVGVTLGVSLERRVPIGFEVFHNRNALTSVSADGRSGNAFEMRIENRSRDVHHYRLRLEDLPEGWELVTGQNPVVLQPLASERLPFFVFAPHGAPRVPRSFDVVLDSEDGEARPIRRQASFLWQGGSHGGV